MNGYAVVGKFDDLGFPTGAHVLLEGEEQTLCGLSGSGFYSQRGGPVDCPECARLLNEALLIDEPGELL